SGRDPEHSGHLLIAQEFDGTVYVDVETCSRVIHKRHVLAECDRRRRLVCDVPRAPIERVRNLPVIEIEGVALVEVERVLAAFGSEPESVFTAENVHVGLTCPRLDCGAPEPAEAWCVAPARRARHDPPLIDGCHRDLCHPLRPRQYDDLCMLG